jgi:hypothetical protein
MASVMVLAPSLSAAVILFDQQPEYLLCRRVLNHARRIAAIRAAAARQ